ncbi:MAG: hydroxyethylthiazole kinase, partial [Erysipelotrichaceae bacterium]
EDRICIAKDLAKKTGSIVVISGSSDIIANDSNAYIVKNGSSKMSDVSGTGCMLGSIIAVYLGANKEEDYLEAVAAAVAMYGYCGELASLNAKGNASFKINLIDEVSKMNNDKLKGGIKIEYK